MDGRQAARRIRALRFISHLSIACAIPLLCAGIWLKIVNSDARVEVRLPISELQSAFSQVQAAPFTSHTIAEAQSLEIKVSAPKITRISSRTLAKRAQKSELTLVELEQEARVAALAFDGWEEIDLAQDSELDEAQHMRLAYFELKNAFQLALLEPVVESIQIAQAVTTHEPTPQIEIKNEPEVSEVVASTHAPVAPSSGEESVQPEPSVEQPLWTVVAPSPQRTRARKEAKKLHQDPAVIRALEQIKKEAQKEEEEITAQSDPKQQPKLGTLVAQNFADAAIAGDIPEIFHRAEVRKFDYSPHAIIVRKVPDLTETTQSIQPTPIVVSQAAPEREQEKARAANTPVNSIASESLNPTHQSVRRGLTPTATVLAPTEWVEAFHWDQEVSGVFKEVFSAEGMRADTNPERFAWLKLTAAKYWTTLARLAPHSRSTPLLSNNTARILASLHDVKIQEQGGIVYGMLEKGWSIEFTGRSEQIIQKEGPAAGQVAFILFNAQPGMHLMHIRQNGTSRSSAVAVPVLGSTATYLDLAKPELLDLDGTIQDATRLDYKGYSGVQVRAIGSSQRAKSDSSGTFRFKDLVTFAAYPIFLEAQGKTGFKHRFQIERKDRNRIQLFLFPQTQVQEWVSQLSGGISAESGLVVGALPGLFAQSESSHFLAKVHSVTGTGTLVPETYGLNREGALDPAAKLEVTAPRFISVQVSEGFSIAQVKDATGQVVWSQSFVSSPGVINVLQPE